MKGRRDKGVVPTQKEEEAKAYFLHRGEKRQGRRPCTEGRRGKAVRLVTAQKLEVCKSYLGLFAI